MMRRLLLSLLTLLTLPALAQVTQPPAPAAAPDRPRYELQMPAGFQKVEVAGHAALCEPGDVEWVTLALKSIKPATRPTTMPADLITRATAARAKIVAQMKADLALADDKAASEFFDAKLLPTLKKFETLRPPVFFLVLARPRLDDLTKDGWGEPRFRFNRVAGVTSYNDNVMLSMDRPMDDAVLPAFVDPKNTPEEKAKKLAAGVVELDTKLAQMVSGQSQLQVFNLIAQHIGEQHMDPLKLRRDQQWLTMGVTAYLTAGYAGEITGINKAVWLQDATFEHPRATLLSARSIDLLAPADESKMKPAAVPHYTQAMRRKAVGVVMAWTSKAGDAAIAKTLTAIRKQPPADGAALVAQIKEQTGVDLAAELRAK
ncbi:MAG TPA: hypothetical protein VEA69_06560 [Tepidisphaeraceae bacterium]|nr:hypothetical protein [Tepidisphaeraceae bacterium]